MQNETIADLTIRVLEEAAFLFTEPSADAVPWDEPSVEARLEVAGGCSAVFSLRLPHSVAVRTAGTLLCAYGEEAEEASGAVTAELLNVLAGALAHAAFGEDARYILVPPELGPFDAPLPVGTSFITLVTFEGEPIEVAVAA